MTATIDFALVRPIFGGKLKQSQVDGINVIVAAWNEYGDGDKRKLAYLLGTAKHETAHTMQPIFERGPRAYFNKYEPGTKIGKVLGNINKGDGYLYRGAGFVQLTGRANFAKAGKKLGLDLIGQPALALVPRYAAAILITGCLEGWFTGKKLGDYINAAKTDFKNARRVINGVDRAVEIAALGTKFLVAIAAAPHPVAQPVPAAPAPVAPGNWAPPLRGPGTTPPFDIPKPAPARPSVHAGEHPAPLPPVAIPGDPASDDDFQPPWRPAKKPNLLDKLKGFLGLKAAESVRDAILPNLPKGNSPMTTPINKAIVALVGSLLFLANTFLGWNLGLSEETLNTVIAVLTPVLVWLIPNKKTA